MEHSVAFNLRQNIEDNGFSEGEIEELNRNGLKRAMSQFQSGYWQGKLNERIYDNNNDDIEAKGW